MKFNKMIKRFIRFCKRNEGENHPIDSFITVRFHYEWNRDKKCNKFSGVYFYLLSPFEKNNEYCSHHDFIKKEGLGAFIRSVHFRYSQNRKYFIKWVNKTFLPYSEKENRI